MFPWGVTIALASAATVLNSALPTFLGLFIGGVLTAMGVFTSRRRVAPAAAVAVLAMVSAVAWFARASVLAISPLTSFMGSLAGHRGTALWCLAAVWLAAGAFAADGRALRHTLSVISVAGGIFTSAALYESIRFGAQRNQGAVAGVFENSSSLGSFLAVALLTSLAWAFIARRGWAKAAPIAFALSAVAGLFLSSSRTGFAGVAFAGAVAILIALLPPSRAKIWVLAVAPPTLVTAIAWLLAVASNGTFGAPLLSLVSAVGTQRDVLWRSALAQIAQSPLQGSGLDQFSAALPWTIGPGGKLSVVFANDPHSMELAVALGGGVIAASIVFIAFAAMLWGGVSIAQSHRRMPGLAIVAAMPVVLLGTGLFNWIVPVAMIAAFAVTGALLGAPPGMPEGKPEQSTPWLTRATRAGAYLLAAGSIALAVIGGLSLPAESAYISTYGSLLSPRRADPTAYETSLDLAQAYDTWHEPSIIRQALRGVAPQLWMGNVLAVPVAETMLADTERDAEWSGDLALNQLLTAEALDKNSQKAFERYAAIAERGAQADPATGLWWALSASQASRLRLNERAADFAKRALEYPVDAESRAYLETIAAP